MKGDRGKHAGHYMLVFELESPVVRDRLYPESGTASPEFERAYEGTEPIWDRLQTFVTAFPSPHFTDYVVIG